MHKVKSITVLLKCKRHACKKKLVCPDRGLIIRPVNDEQKLLPSWGVSDPSSLLACLSFVPATILNMTTQQSQQLKLFHKMASDYSLEQWVNFWKLAGKNTDIKTDKKTWWVGRSMSYWLRCDVHSSEKNMHAIIQDIASPPDLCPFISVDHQQWTSETPASWYLQQHRWSCLKTRSWSFQEQYHRWRRRLEAKLREEAPRSQPPLWSVCPLWSAVLGWNQAPLFLNIMSSLVRSDAEAP